MQDKSWLLNPSAIASAKACIKIVESELGVKLKLSHPQFLVMLKEYADLTDSAPLKNAFKVLLSHAKSESTKSAEAKVVKLKNSLVLDAGGEEQNSAEEETELVEYKGKTYRRWRDGKEFRGLYRGQPRYA